MIIPDSEVDCSDLFRAYFAGEKSLFSPPEESLYGASSVKSGEEPSKFDNVLGLPMAATGYFIMDSNNFNSNNMDLGKHGNEGQFDVLSGLWDDLKVFDGLNGDLDVDGLAPLGDGGDVDWSVYYQQDWNNFTVEYGQDYGGPQPASISSFVLPGPSQSAAVMEDYAIQSTPVSVVIKEEQPNGHYEQLGPFTGTPVLEDVKEKRTFSRRAVASRKAKEADFTRPLVERQKRPSDDETESVSSVVSDGSAGATIGGLPSLPRIAAVSVVAENATKRQRKDISMSAPAVAARELRQKRKAAEEQLIAECATLKANAEKQEREKSVAWGKLLKLREDASYLRSLVANQQSTVALLEYLQRAPFFQGGNQKLQLDSRSMLSQIIGSIPGAEHPEPIGESLKSDIGGVCLHINGSNISLHLCTHCSSDGAAVAK